MHRLFSWGARAPRAVKSRPLAMRPLTLAINVLLMGGAASMSTWTADVHAQTTSASPAAQQSATTKRYDIPAGKLSEVLMAFSSASGVFLAGATNATDGKASAGLHGTYTVQGGLAALLEGTGLVAVQHGDGSFSLQTVSAERATVALAPVHVVAERVSALAPAELFAGGQVARGGQLGMLGTTDFLDAPFNITSYTSQLIENQQARSISEVMANDPSVRASVSSGSIYENVSIRGFSLASSELAFMGLYGLMPISRSPTGFAERVDVIKGPAAMVTSMPPSGGIGGTISVTPKRAGDDPLARVSTSFDTNSLLGVEADVGRRFGPDGAIGVRVNGVARGGEGPVKDVDHQSRLASLGLDYRGKDLRLSLDTYYQTEVQDGGTYGIYGFTDPTALPKAPDSARSPTKGEHAHIQDRMVLLSGEYDITPDITAYARYGWHDSDVVAKRGAFKTLNADGSYLGALTVQNIEQKYRSGEAGVRAEVNTGPVHHRVVANIIDYANVTMTGLYTAQAANYISSNIYNPTAFNDPPQWPADRYKSAETHLRSVAIADTLSMFRDRVLLTLGLRHQRVVVENFSTTTGAITSSYDKGATTPAVGLVVKPLANVSVYANYIQGLTKGPTAPTGTGLSNAGEVFAPYKSEQYEVGVKGEWEGRGASLSAFQISRPNAITDNNRYSLDGEQRNRGIEVNVFGEPVKGVRVLGGVAFMNARITKASSSTQGNRAAGIPQEQLNLGLEWDPSFVPGLTLSSRMVQTGSVYINSANSASIPSWTRFDAGARYATRISGKNVIFRLNVDNVFGRDYWMASDVENWLSLSAPRTLRLSATIDF